MQIEEKPPAPPFETPFAWIGGEARVRALVDWFYDLMDLEPAYAHLRGIHGNTLENARDRLCSGFSAAGWAGLAHPRGSFASSPLAGGGALAPAKPDAGPCWKCWHFLNERVGARTGGGAN